MKHKIFIFITFLLSINEVSLETCHILDHFSCEILGQEFETPEEYDKCAFQTPPRNDIFGNYLPTYQDMRYLVGWVELKYNAEKTRCIVTFHNRVNPDLGIKDKDYQIYYTFGDLEEQESNTFEFTSRDDSYPNGIPVSCRIIDMKTGNEFASLQLEDMYFIWDNIEINTSPEYQNGQRGSIVELFGWPYEDVEQECEFLGIAGYLGLKIFSPFETLLTKTMPEGTNLNPYWYGIQFVSFKYESRYGNQKQLKKMINRCRANNVRVYADIIINHTTGDGNDMNPIHYYDFESDCNTWGPKTGSGGSPFYTCAYQINNNLYTNQPPANENPAVPYFPSDFHCKREIEDWDIPTQLCYGSLAGLQDINTEKDYPQKRIATYIVDLLSIGISGVMLENGRHIPNYSWAKIFRYTKEYLGNILPLDFFAVIIFDNIDIYTNICNKTEEILDFGPYFTNLLKVEGFTDNEILQIKFWFQGNLAYEDYLEQYDVSCGYKNEDNLLFDVKRWTISLEYSDDINMDNDDYNIYIRNKNIQEHKNILINDMFLHPRFNYAIRFVFTSYSINYGSFGVPDGKSEISFCSSESCKESTVDLPYRRAFNPNSTGYDCGDGEDNWIIGEYSRIHRDIDIVNAMREWMCNSPICHLTAEELYKKKKLKTNCEEKCLICSEESEKEDKCILCNLNKNYYPVILNDYSEQLYECHKKNEKLERLFFSYKDKGFLPCYETCLYCDELGDSNNHKCTACDYNYIKSLDVKDSSKTFNCIIQCNYNYYYNNYGQYKCTESPICPLERNIHVEKKKKCVSSCKEEDPYIYLFNGDCVETCPSGYLADENNNICKLISTELCTINSKEIKFISLYNINMLNSLTKEYKDEFTYTDKHFINITNSNYSIIIFKDLDCLKQFNLNIPDLRFTTNGPYEEKNELNKSKEDSCYTKVQNFFNIDEKLIVVFFEDNNNFEKGYLLYNPITGKKTNFESICREEDLNEKEEVSVTDDGNEKKIFKYIFLRPSQNVSPFKINYFYENNKLCYVNALNDDKDNLYFEFWGENDNIRYFTGKNATTEESILFDNNEIFYIDSKIYSNYHESIIVNYNNDTNIFSFDDKNFNFIRLKTKEIFSKGTLNIISNYNYDDNFSFRNSIIKLDKKNYLLSLFNKDYINLISFNFISEDIDGFKVIDNYSKEASYSNSTECFQTEALYIQCLFSPKDLINQFTINIYTQNIIELNSNISLGYYANSTFTKIFHLKNEIGIYIFFDIKDYNRPKIFFEKLINNNLYDLFDFNGDTNKNNGHQYITLDANGTINNIDNNLFYSDAIKVNNSKFVVIFTKKQKNELIICLFDLYNYDSSLRLRYYKLNLDLMNIKISVNLRAFIFKKYFGIIFYNLFNGYPGFLFFNYPNITSNYKTNITTIEIKIFVDSTEPYFFSLKDILEIKNNIYGGIEKIKIINYISTEQTGVIIKSSKFNQEIYLNQILDIDDLLIFEQSSEGIIPGNHILEFIPITKLSNVDNNIYKTFYYGNGQENDFDDIEYYSEETYKLIYSIECYHKCQSCRRLGNELNYNCVKCKGKNTLNINDGEKCICNGYYFINEYDEYICQNDCDYYKYILSENEKYCLSSCEYNKKILFKDEANKSCYESCSENINENKYSFENNCVETCPNNYIPDENGICYNKDCKYDLLLDENKFEDYCKGLGLKKYLNMTKVDNGEDFMIKEEKITYTITSTKKQNSLKNISYELSIIDLSECQQKLIEKNIIKKDQNLYINKFDFQIEGMKVPKVDYDVYYYLDNSSKLTLLNLSLCENTLTNIIFQVTINKNEIDKYNISSDYYNDICDSYTTEDGTDFPLKDRQKEYIEKNLSICEEGCYFSEYNFDLNKAICSCLTDTKMMNFSLTNFNISTRINMSFKKTKNSANFGLINCFPLLFNKIKYRSNSANYIMMISFIIGIMDLILFILRGYNNIKNIIGEIIETKRLKEKIPNINEIKERKEIKSHENSQNNNPSGTLQIFSSIDELKINSKRKLEPIKDRKEININNNNIYINDKIENKVTENEKNQENIEENKNNINFYTERKNELENIIYNDSELNILNYEEAKKCDERIYCQYYLSLVKTRHILISLFYEDNDYKIGIIKNYIFIFIFAVNYSISILFYDYKTLHKIYEEKGKFNFAFQLPQIIYSSLITIFIANLIKKLLLCENNIILIKNAKINDLEQVQKQELNIIFLKYILFFIITYILLLFFWIYSVSFCIVYKNTQNHLLVDAIISFLFTCIISLVLFLVPGIFRILSLQSGKLQKYWMYNVSKILQFILC